jgi:hypothetical protein
MRWRFILRYQRGVCTWNLGSGVVDFTTFITHPDHHNNLKVHARVGICNLSCPRDRFCCARSAGLECHSAPANISFYPHSLGPWFRSKSTLQD